MTSEAESMQLFPTIHIKNGKCYSTTSKDVLGKHNIYTSRPAKLASIWEAEGAKWLHVVDVDGATVGTPANEDVVREILETVHIPVQFGGGLRTVKDIDNFLNMGVARVVCGTKPVQSQRFAAEAVSLFGADRFVVGIDALNGMVAIEGREKICDFNAVSLIHKLREAGVKTVIYTDVMRSIAHGGSSLENIRELVARTDLEVLVAGGIDHMNDLKAMEQLGVDGAVIAAALYEGRILLNEAVRLFDK